MAWALEMTHYLRWNGLLAMAPGRLRMSADDF